MPKEGRLQRLREGVDDVLVVVVDEEDLVLSGVVIMMVLGGGDEGEAEAEVWEIFSLDGMRTFSCYYILENLIYSREIVSCFSFVYP